MGKSIEKNSRDNLYGFTIDLSFLDCVFQTPYKEETIDIDYEDITHQKGLLKSNGVVKKQYRKTKNGGVIFKFLSFINVL